MIAHKLELAAATTIRTATIEVAGSRYGRRGKRSRMNGGERRRRADADADGRTGKKLSKKRLMSAESVFGRRKREREDGGDLYCKFALK